MINISTIQDCPNVATAENKKYSSNGNNGDFSNYVVPGVGVIIQVF